MELRETVTKRRMVRAYDPDRPVAPAVLDGLLDLVPRAPSAGGAQGRDAVVLRSAADRERFWRAASDDVDAPDRWLTGMMAAPVLVLLLADPGAYARRYAGADKQRAAAEHAAAPDGVVPWWDVDTGMSALLLLLGAVDAGLGACFFGVPAPRHDRVRDAFAVPADRRVVGAVSLGHAAAGPGGTAGPGGAGGAGAGRPAARPRPRGVGEVAHDGRFGAPWTSGAVVPPRP